MWQVRGKEKGSSKSCSGQEDRHDCGRIRYELLLCVSCVSSTSRCVEIAMLPLMNYLES